MKIRTFLAAFLIICSLSACAPAATPLPPTATCGPLPTATRTLVPTPRPTATATVKPTMAPMPESPQVAFVSNEHGNLDVYRINLDGTGKTQLTFNTSDERRPAWSPDGSKLAYQVKQGELWQIMVMNWDGSDPVQLTSEGNNNHPSWSPDGSRILFESKRSGNWDIYLMDANGENQAALTTHPANDFVPAWSPDGSTIAYLSEQDATTEECEQNAFGTCPQEIFMIDPTGKFVQKITDLKEHIDSIKWSPDGQTLSVLLYYNEGTEIKFYDLPSQTFKPGVNMSEVLDSIYPVGPYYRYFRSFSFSPQGINGLFCLNQDLVNNTISGCYLVGLDGEMLFTLVRSDSRGDYTDAVWQP